METTPPIDKAAAFFNAHTVELGLDIKDRVAVSIVDIRSGGVSRRCPWSMAPQR